MTKPEFRVLTGRHRGACHPIGAGRITVGYEYWHDIVLHEPATAGLAIELDVNDHGCAGLSVLSGCVALLGNRLAAGASATLPPFVPLHVGDAAFAWGDADSPRWAEAEALAATPGALPPAIAANDPWRHTPVGGLMRFARSSAALMAALAVGAVAMVPNGFDPRANPARDRDRAVAALAAAGYPSLSVRADADGAITVAGRIASEADRPAVTYALAAAEVPATLALRSDVELARAVADSARINGFDVTAKLVAGAIELHHSALDPAARARLVEVIRRDVPGVGRLRLANDNPARPAPMLASISDATHRVSSVVAGNPGWIATADGGHYFPGSVLPSGHRLVAIETAAVILENAGQRTRLAF
jgi:type III secretion protein D